MKLNKPSVLFVCTENICRSPLAEGLMKYKLNQLNLNHEIHVESAGTKVSQPGHRPDIRAQRIAASRGIDITKNKARLIKNSDFEKFDHILLMDERNLNELVKRCPENYLEKLSLILNYLDDEDVRDVPDPYFGNLQGFQEVFNLLDEAIDSFIDETF